MVTIKGRCERVVKLRLWNNYCRVCYYISWITQRQSKCNQTSFIIMVFDRCVFFIFSRKWEDWNEKTFCNFRKPHLKHIIRTSATSNQQYFVILLKAMRGQVWCCLWSKNLKDWGTRFINSRPSMGNLVRRTISWDIVHC